MKKLIVGLLAAFLMTTGLVAFTSSTATAACPYTGCIATKTIASDKVTRNKVVVKVRVKPVGSNGTPKGLVKLKVKGPEFASTTKGIRGSTSLSIGKLKPGKYTYTVSYVPSGGSVFKKSSTTGSFRIKK